MRHLAFINIIVTFMVMILGSIIPHHHHKSLICTIEHLCEHHHDDLVFHDHEGQDDASSDNDEHFCLAHESYRIPTTAYQIPNLSSLTATLTTQVSFAIPQILTQVHYFSFNIYLTAQFISQPPLRAPPFSLA
ncbi:MAG: hypothetical protein MJZ61_08495 [Bacteroidales bacterium]|nr:hypothetical protein [Bacteroidales bacterium]